MLKRINKLDSLFDGDLIIDESTMNKINNVWKEFIKDKKSSDFFDGDIYSVNNVDEKKTFITFSKTKFSCLIYSKKTDDLEIRSLFSAGYIVTSDNYIGIILNYRDKLNLIGGMADNVDIINNKFDYERCYVREFKEELGFDLDENNNFEISLKYLKYPFGDELEKSCYPVGTIFETKTKFTKNDLIELFNKNEHENEVKELKFYNIDNYKDVYSYDERADYLDELFSLLFL